MTDLMQLAPGQLVTVWVRGQAGLDMFTGTVTSNDPLLGLDITEDDRSRSGWSWDLIDRVDVLS